MGLKNFGLQNLKFKDYMEVISKSMIEKWIVPYLSIGKRGAKADVAISAIVRAYPAPVKDGRAMALFTFKSIFWRWCHYLERRVLSLQ